MATKAENRRGIIYHLARRIAYELEPGTHTFHDCICGGIARRDPCWQCLLDRIDEQEEALKAEESAKPTGNAPPESLTRFTDEDVIPGVNWPPAVARANDAMDKLTARVLEDE